MYAIVKTGGKQYRVERGQRLLVERLPVAEGDTVALEPILYRSDEAVFDRAGLQKVRVTARVIAHERGEKLRVFKFKPKRGYKRRTGHRQELTRIEVTELALGGGSKAKAAKEAAPATAESPKAAPARSASAKAAAGTAEPARATKQPAKSAAGSAKPAPAKPAGAKAAGAARAKTDDKAKAETAKEATEDGA
jgi:large subunit ribosomal protein L21